MLKDTQMDVIEEYYDETEVIVSWDDHAVKNADIQLVEAVRQR